MENGIVRIREARNHPRADVPPPVLTLASGRQHTAATILQAWREGKSEHTLRAMQYDADDFARFLSRSLAISPLMSAEQALERLFRQSSSSAHEIVLRWRNYLQHDCGLSSASVNRHLATLRSVSKLARMLGAVKGGWYIEVPGVKPERRRSTAGPTVDDVRTMLAATNGDTEAETRDAAIVWVFFALGLRVSELCGLTLDETDLVRGTAWILGKGRREKELIPLPLPVVEAIRRYLVFRGTNRGPLFQTRGIRGKARDGSLESRSVLRIIRKLGQRVGLHVWCHSLRHTSITQAAELGQKQGLGLDKIRAHSRHRSIMTLMLYVDEHDRKRTQTTLADLVADSLAAPAPMTATMAQRS